MSLFQCQKCGCAENTVYSNRGHWGKLPAMAELFLWEYPEDKGKMLCSACGPGQFANGKVNTGGGGWHGKFERVFLPIGEFETNREGNLQHVETKDTDYRKYAITPSPVT